MSLIKDFGHYEWNLIQGSNTLDKSHFSSGTLNDAVFQQFTIGAVVARQLNLTLWNADLNTTDSIVLSCKAVSFDGTETTIPKGTYFIDTLDTSPYSEYSELVAFDAMLKTQVVYMKSGTYTPKTSLQLVQEIASDIGVTIEADTLTFITNNAFSFTQAPNIGTSEGTTDREILSVIGIYHGGNWIINDNNELELVRAYGSLLGNNLVTVGTDGKFYSTWLAEVEDSTTVVRINSSGKFETILYGSCDDSAVLWYIGRDGKNYTDTLANILANSASDMAVEIGDEVVDFDVSPTEVITRIELVVSNKLSYRSPSGLTEEEWQALGGRLVSVDMPLMASQAVADKLYDMYAGLSVVPYESQSAYFSPDVKLGRMLKIKDRKVVLTNRTLTIDSLASSDLILEPQQRLQSNYPYLDPITRQINREISKTKQELETSITVLDGRISSEVARATAAEGNLSSRITQTDERIESEVARATAAEGNLGTRLTQTATEIRAELTDYEDEVSTYVRFGSDGVEIGKSDSQFKTFVDNTQVYFTGSDGQKAAGISGTVFETKRLEAEEYVSVGHWKWYEDPTDNTFNLVYEA